MNRAIDDLTREHEAILMALRILGNICQRLENQGRVSVSDLTSFVEFFKEFVDRCHHGKEEGFLFPALSNADSPEAKSALEVLLKEHDQGREGLSAMSSALHPALDMTAFIQASKGYSALLVAHIDKENKVLFPLADRALSPTQLDALYQAFERHEQQVIGQGRHEALHALLKALKSQYSAT
jgi:hemerythrin-like domain-containing protein